MWLVYSVPMDIDLSHVEATIGKVDCSIGKCGITWFVLMDPQCEYTVKGIHLLIYMEGPIGSVGVPRAIWLSFVLSTMFLSGHWLWCKSFGKVDFGCDTLCHYARCTYMCHLWFFGIHLWNATFPSCVNAMVQNWELLNIYFGVLLTPKSKPKWWWRYSDTPTNKTEVSTPSHG